MTSPATSVKVVCVWFPKNNGRRYGVCFTNINNYACYELCSGKTMAIQMNASL